MAYDVGETLEIRITFRDWEEGSATFGNAVDPETVEVTITDGSGNQDTDSAIREGTGIYAFEYTPNTVGDHAVQFIGTFEDGSTSIVNTDFYVGADGSLKYLDKSYEFTFIADLDPILVDPEEFQFHYPDATLSEIAELAYRFSKEVRGYYPEGTELPPVALDYIRAAIECSLFRTYDMGFAGAGSSYTLGDLSVSNDPGSRRSNVDRATATTPCELAAALRSEMLRGKANIKAVVTGRKHRNPMPRRHIKRAEKF